VSPRELRIGYHRSAFERAESENDRRRKGFDDASLDVLRGIGAELIPIETPGDYPLNAVRGAILATEAAAAFDQLTRTGEDDLMVDSSWPNTFRQARLVPAVEYIQANRVRTLIMGAMHAAMAGIDVLVAPTSGGNQLLLTNLTGHPAVILPNGFTDEGSPVSITFVGNLYGEAAALAVAKAYQDATDFHTRRPPLFAV
jgi:Asp-tRNA(Asn)/Glu-tRNA(Gln) amidotransferase A subunit family amidase